MMRITRTYISAALLFLLLPAVKCGTPPPAVVNLSHLDALCEDVTIQGRACAIVHIYADAPDYGWTDASGEGIACVDDVARAAVLYMRAAALEGGSAAPQRQERIRRLLQFVLLMQTEDGTFYNFIHRDLTINRDGVTSRRMFGFWAARGYWALAEGFAFFRTRDAAFADELRQAFLRCRQQLEILSEKYGSYTESGGVRYPDWLLGGHGADATSEFLLGAAAFLAVERDTALARQAAQLAEGVAAMQVRDDPALRDAFLPWPAIWHAWGNAQIQALAALSVATGERGLLPIAIQGARFPVKLLAGHWLSEYDLATGEARAWPQIAYGVRTTALGFLELYRATGDADYAVLAGVAASWLTGNNLAGVPLYDPATGRCFDGIDQKGINRNSGAESTIEALYTLVEISRVPAAAAWLHARSPEAWGTGAWPTGTDLRRTFTAAAGQLSVTWLDRDGSFLIERIMD